MAQTDRPTGKKNAKGGNPPRSPALSRLEAAVLLPNLLLVGVVVLYMVAVYGGANRVAPLVETDAKTTVRIQQLELALERQPSDLSGAIELARLYREVGEFSWSYQALKNAEQQQRKEPMWRLLLGLAYLELGKNDDAIRVLEETARRCAPAGCQANVKLKLALFTRVARLFKARRIDARKHNAAAEKALHEVLKPVGVDPAKMRPKGPATPQPAPKGAPKAGPRS